MLKVRTAAALNVGVDALRAHPLRTVLSTLGVVIGVAALVAILALGDGLEAFSREQLEATTDLHTITIDARTTDRVDGMIVRREDVSTLTIDDEAALAAHLSDRASVALRLGSVAWVRWPADTLRRATALVAGTAALRGQLPDSLLAAGRFLSSDDVVSVRRVAVLSHALARQLAPDVALSSLLSRVVGIAGNDYEVIGVLAAANPSGTAAPARVIVPVSALPEALASLRTPTLAIRARRLEDVTSLREEAAAWLERRQPGSGANYSIVTQQRRVEQASQGMRVMQLALGAITGISILVGGIGIMNNMLASVHERTREIGIRKATGARATDIQLQFLAESVTISSVGSAIGLVLGLAGAVGVTAVIRTLTDAPVHAAFTWTTLAIAAIISVSVGIAFGTYPARRAAALSPIDAIRHE